MIAFLQVLLFAFMVILMLFMLLIILLQRGKGGGLVGAFGGVGGNSAFGAKSSDVFVKITVWTAIIWFVLCVAGGYVFKKTGRGSQLVADAPAAAPAQTPAAGDAPAADTAPAADAAAPAEAPASDASVAPATEAVPAETPASDAAAPAEN